MKDLTPRMIVEELDKYIIGQEQAKRSVAVAIRNRWRRQQLPPEIGEEILPKNIIMIGPTGVGKTEISRRLANLVNAPFLKVEASKYTEVGYHGRDVESMIRDLVEVSVNMVRSEHMGLVEPKAEELAGERLLDILLPPPSEVRERKGFEEKRAEEGALSDEEASWMRTRKKMAEKLRKGDLEERIIELKVDERAMPWVEVLSSSGVEFMGFDFQNWFERMSPQRSTIKKATVRDARKLLKNQEMEKLIDKEKVTEQALERAQNMGLIFIDELDKIAGRETSYGPDVSRGGVQRDLLPIVEGSTVLTRYGVVKTDHILFIAAGAFHMSKPSDLIPELQGRFPIRVELKALSRDDFVRILREPKNAITKQYQALLKTEGIDLKFEEDGIEEMAELAVQVNQKTQNIGARRLYTILEKLLESPSFDAPDLPKKSRSITIDRAYVRERLKDIVEDENLSKYIL